jgi:hypothetical protein
MAELERCSTCDVCNDQLRQELVDDSGDLHDAIEAVRGLLPIAEEALASQGVIQGDECFSNWRSAIAAGRDVLSEANS